MQTKMIVIAGGMVAVAAAAGAFIFASRNNAEQTDGRGAAETAPARDEYSLRDFLTAHENMRCTFSYEDEDVRSSGVAYVASERVRVDAESSVTPTGMTTQTSTIIDPEYAHVWTAGSNEGYRIAFAAVEAGTAESGAGAPDYDEKHQYDCEPWSVDESRFQPPAGVTFIDPMEALQGLMPRADGEAAGGASVDMRAEMCALCDQAGDPTAAAQCKAALGCG